MYTVPLGKLLEEDGISKNMANASLMDWMKAALLFKTFRLKLMFRYIRNALRKGEIE